MPRPDPQVPVNVLFKREACLQTLEGNPLSKPEIVETLDIPRSTLDDIIRELEAANLVEYTDGKWQLTLFGQYTFEYHILYKNKIESIVDAEPIIDALPRDTLIERHLFTDADIYISSPPVPDEIMEVVLNAVESVNRVRGVTPVVLAGYCGSFYRCATTGTNSSLEIILSIDSFERLQKLQPDKTDEIIRDNNVEIYSGGIPIAFSLWIGDDDHVGLIVYANNGIQGVIINEKDKALKWANKQYERIQKSSEPAFNCESES